ncbi:MAG: tripartite tricarboxylate transporter TctB family protein [Chloroflexota bacterium]
MMTDGVSAGTPAPTRLQRLRLGPNGWFALLLAVVCSYFVWAAMSWPSGAALLPRTAGIFGLLMLAGYAISSFQGRGANTGQILDVGRLEHGDTDTVAVRGRTLRAIGSLLVLVLSIWAVGFHVAIPTFVSFYLWYWGKVDWWRAVIAGVIFLGIIVGLYDNVLHVTWHTSLLDMLLGRGGGN